MRDAVRHESPRLVWHILTGEYPPQTGGVSDYTRLVARGLAAAGDEVHVWCPAPTRVFDGEAEEDGRNNVDGANDIGTNGIGASGVELENDGASAEGGVFVHRVCGSFSPADLRRVGKMIDATRGGGPRRLLVQYVPHAFGRRSVNVRFCLWVWARARRRGERVEVMVHEPFLEFRRGAWRQSAAAAAHRLMTAILLRAASRVWTAIPAWETLWRPYAFGRRVTFEWLPVPNAVAVINDAAAISKVRERFAPTGGGLLVGHLGTYPLHVARELENVLPTLLEREPSVTVLLMGRGSEETCDAILIRHPRLAGRLRASGVLTARELSAHLSACDLVLQPFADGVSTRRTSVMAALEHARAVVTTEGRFTESLWAESGAVALAPAGDREELLSTVVRLLGDAGERERTAAAGRALYRERFDAAKTIAALRRADGMGETVADGGSRIAADGVIETDARGAREIAGESAGEVLSDGCVSRS